MRSITGDEKIWLNTGDIMKKIIICMLSLMTLSSYAQDISNSFEESPDQVQKIMECEAIGVKDGESIFEIKSDVYNSGATVQGTTVTSTLGQDVKVASLMLESETRFQSTFSISLLVKYGEKIIESEKLSNLSFNSPVRVFGINKRLPGYEMHLTCTKL